MTPLKLHPNVSRRLGSGGNPGGARAVKEHSLFSKMGPAGWNKIASRQETAPYMPQIEGTYDTGNFYEPAVKAEMVDVEGVDPKTVHAGEKWNLT